MLAWTKKGKRFGRGAHVGAFILAGLSTACAAHGSPAASLPRVSPTALNRAVSSPSTSEATAPSSRGAAAAPVKPGVSPKGGAQAVESWDPRLAAALASLAQEETPAALRRVAAEYRRLGISDMADRYLQRALRIDPGDASTYDSRARLWRDAGFPAMGLTDAYRAVSLAPSSAAAANTIGTIFERLNRGQDARKWYSRALELDSRATFALINLCHLETVMKKTDAVDACRRALAETPDSVVAHNNLGLAYAAAGDFARARTEFFEFNDVATAEYNTGIVYMAARQFENASWAFRQAWQANPDFFLASRRLKQALAAR